MHTDSNPNTSQQLITQLSLSASTNSNRPQSPFVDDLSRKESRFENASPKLRLTDYATPPSSVSAFCRAVLQKLVPREFFGCGEDGNSNQRCLMMQIDRFIRLSRFESLTLHEVCKGLKVYKTFLFFQTREYANLIRSLLFTGLHIQATNPRLAIDCASPTFANEQKSYMSWYITYLIHY